MSRTVVIGLDKSDLSARALPFARHIAHLWPGRLVLVHAGGTPHEDLLAGMLGDLVRSLGQEGIKADAVTRVAPPALAITEVANEQNADLIVMASHQRHGLNRWLNGSVTEAVLASTSIPLLVVPALSEPPPLDSSRILVPLDGTDVGEAALEFLRQWSSAKRPLQLLLVRVLSYGSGVLGLDSAYTVLPLSSADIEMEVQEAGKYLSRLVETLGVGNVSARYRVIETSEPVAKVILDTAQRERVNTIALGSHGKAGVSRFVLGSVSEEVLERSQAPVVLVHAAPQAVGAAQHKNREASAPMHKRGLAL